MTKNLETFFKPKTIAVVGASKDSRKIGHAALKNLLISDYQSKIYPINPKEESILGIKCYKKVTDVMGNIDLVLISVPAAIDPSFVYGNPRKGSIALISQSGALGIGMIYLANNEYMGVSKIVGVGNKIDIDDDDLIDYFANDPETEVIGLYIEA